MINPDNLDDERKSLLATTGHILVQGGPGSGKTTIALLKAQKEIESGCLKPSQKILFLSFARATVIRIEEHLQRLMGKNTLNAKSIEISTYHSFAWSIIKSHGYLIIGRRNLKVLTPASQRARLAFVDEKNHSTELIRLMREEGLVSFDLFAHLVGELLSKYQRVRELISNCYPIIMVDEFQDTNSDEWAIIKSLGQASNIVALADPEQRIYDFRGANANRIDEFKISFNPTEFHFKAQNHRSSGTDIAQFGNDLLTGVNRQQTYHDVVIIKYQHRHNNLLTLRYVIYQAVKRLAGEKEWSLAILVKTGSLMVNISSYLSQSTEKHPSLPHNVVIDPVGPALAASFLAILLEPARKMDTLKKELTIALIQHIQGQKKKISKVNQELIKALNNFLTDGKIRGSRRKELVDSIETLALCVMSVNYSGDPEKDWLHVRDWVLNSKSDFIRRVGVDAKYLRLLNRGSMLRAGLTQQWQKTGDYSNARQIVQNALRHEYFATPRRKFTGINLMTIHKSKGKEFDEVIIFEEAHRNRLVYDAASSVSVAQAKYMLRVAVTRAKRRCTILTPAQKPCELL